MPQSKVITSDASERLQFKAKLSSKIEAALTPVAKPAAKMTVLLVPHNHAELSESELLYTLTHNSELMHSLASARTTVEVLQGRADPTTYRFKEVELASPAPLPEFHENPVQRVPTRPAPGFARSRDTSPERLAAEAYKKQQFKDSLADKLQRSLTEPPKPVVEKKVLPRVHVADGPPAVPNAMKSLNTKPRHTLRARALDVTNGEQGGGEVQLLPANYLELSEFEIGSLLTRNPEYKCTPDTAAFVLDILFARAARPSDLCFAVSQSEEPAPQDPEPKPEPITVTLPSNHKDFNTLDLHTILLSRGYADDVATEAVKVLRGVEQPDRVVLQVSDLPVVMDPPAAAKPVASKRVKKKVRPKDVTSTSAYAAADRVLLLPTNYLELTEAQLYNKLRYSTEYKQTHDDVFLSLDVVYGRKGQPPTIRFETLQVEEVSISAIGPDPEPARDPVVVMIPQNHTAFSAPDLDTILRRDYSEEIATLAVKVLRGMAPPDNITLRVSDQPAAFERAPVKRPIKKASNGPPPARDVTSWSAESAERVLLLPTNYLELTEAQLYNKLRYSTEYKQTHDDVFLSLDVVYGRKGQPPTIRFETLQEE